MTGIVLILLALLFGCQGAPESYTVDPGTTGEFPLEQAGAAWPGWGGPRGDFQLAGRELATEWPAEGPPLLWSRPLGAGYSAIASVAGALFTHYRIDDEEIVIALRAGDGVTIWEHRYIAEALEGNATEFGSGPNATPLIVGDRVITLGYSGKVHALDLVSGEVLWSFDLIEDHGGEILDFGYSASPMLHDGNVVLLVGGSKQAVLVVDPADGSTVWTSAPGSVSYATPIVIDVDGRTQLVYLSADEVVGLDATQGAPIWRRPCANEFNNNATAPLWGDDGLLWVATQRDGGTRVLRPAIDGAEEVWFRHEIGAHYWNSLRLGDHAYLSIGGQGSMVAAVEIASGEIAWRQRGFSKANFLHVGEQTILLDARGQLALVELSPEQMRVLAQVEVVDAETWTVPTLLDTRLYLRDQQSIRALELGQRPAPTE